MQLFCLDKLCAVVVGGGGVLGGAMATGLARAGAAVAVCDLDGSAATRIADLSSAANPSGTRSKGYRVDAQQLSSLTACSEEVIKDFGRVDILVNAVGGNNRDASTNDDTSFFELSTDALERVLRLNIMGGAMMPCQVFAKLIAESTAGGSIINISSMNAFRPLTRIPGYSAAKAAVSNFTKWLATDLALKYGGKVRVNAIAPGFFITNQNRYLLVDTTTGILSERGESIIAHTPMRRFGEPEDLVGTVVWLASPASGFVTGTVIPVDGGFSAYSGV